MVVLENVYVVFVEAESSGNIGAIARAMRNFGLEKLVLVKPKAEINSEAIAFAMHGRDILERAKIVKTINEALSDTDMVIGTTAISGGDYNPLRTCIPVRELGKTVFPQEGKVSILFGRESSGLTNRELDLCDFVVTVPASDDYPTLNVSQAAVIVFYELFQTVRKRVFKHSRLAKKSEKELILKFLSDTLDVIDFPHHKKYGAMRIFQSLIGRAMITGREAYTLLGIFRRILQYIKNHGKNRE